MNPERKDQGKMNTEKKNNNFKMLKTINDSLK